MTKLSRLLKYIQTRYIPAEIYSKIIFKKLMGYKLDLDNPKTLNEKLQWMKLRGPKFINPVMVDKYKVREHIKNLFSGKYLIPLIGVYNSHESLPEPKKDDLPLIIKTNHDSGVGAIYRSLNDHDINNVKKIMRNRMLTNHYHSSKEYPYKNIRPYILVERLLLDKNGKIPNDYKFHYFNGILEFIYCSIDREGEDVRHIYCPDWKRQSFGWGKDESKFKNNSKDIAKPENFDLMCEISKKIASDYPYVRVDLYNVDGNVFFGEMTFFQGSGFDRIFPYEKDLELGDKIILENLEKKNDFKYS